MQVPKSLVSGCAFSFQMPCKSGSGEILTLPCNRCATCRAKKRFEWVVRMELEDRTALTTWFITLTYDEKHVPRTKGFTHLQKNDALNFIRRVKDFEERNVPEHHVIPNQYHGDPSRKIRYFLVGEYGSKTYRPHYHLILWNISKYTAQRVSQIWGKGIQSRAEKPRGQSAVATYCAKYIMKEHGDIQFVVPQFKTGSNSIGLEHVLKNRSNVRDGLLYHGKYVIPIPKYWRYKFYLDSDEEPTEGDPRTEYWEQIKTLCEAKTIKQSNEDFLSVLEELEGSFDDAWELIEQKKFEKLEHHERLTNRKALNPV